MYVLSIGFAIRFLIPTVIPSLPYTISSVEVTTPITSFKSLHEAFYYLQHGINLYEGGVNHHPPLLVVLLYFVNELPYSYVLLNLLYALTDVWIAHRLVKLNQWYAARQTAGGRSLAPGKASPFSGHLIACFFLFNPLIIVTNLSHSTLVFGYLFLIESIYQIVNQAVARGMILLAVASYINYTPVYMVVPLVSLAYAVTRLKSQVVEAVGVFVSALGFLVLASFAMTSSWQFVDSCWLSIVRFDKISPNLGLWWYFFTEMFSFFTPFFIGIFNLFSVVFIIPISIRFSENTPISKVVPEIQEEAKEESEEEPKAPEEPEVPEVPEVPETRDEDSTTSSTSVVQVGDALLSVVLCLTWLNFTKPYPTLGDLGIILSLIPIFRSSFLTHCKFGGIYGLFLFGSLLLSPIFYYCWIVLGNGNSNFFYSINLVWGGVYGGILMDLLWGKLTFDYINENNVSKELQGKLRLTQT